jgi:hypothetical protein
MIFEGLAEEEIPIPFVDDYRDLLKWRNHSLIQIAYEVLLPALLKKLNTFPLSFKQFLIKALETAKSQNIIEIEKLKKLIPEITPEAETQDHTKLN